MKTKRGRRGVYQKKPKTYVKEVRRKLFIRILSSFQFAKNIFEMRIVDII